MTEGTTVPDLYRLAVMPGCFRCEKCGFTLTKACINPNLEVIGTREQDRESESIPTRRRPRNGEEDHTEN